MPSRAPEPRPETRPETEAGAEPPDRRGAGAGPALHGGRRYGAGASPDRRLRFRPGFVVATSAAMEEVYRHLAAVAASSLPILLVGETGVGKEHLAHLVHDSSPRRGGPFVAVNCAALPADLLEAELFGIEEGVATGVRRRRGCFRQADGGTLFLDEVGEMAPLLQAKLLRVLQDGEVRPVGGRPMGVDVRLVSATNAHLARHRRRRRFRDDLYYRLAGFEVRIPSLRERPEDVPPLAQHFVRVFGEQAGLGDPGIEAEALELLAGRPWPGNVRQLEHEVRRLVYLAPRGRPIRADLVSHAPGGPAPAVPDLPADPAAAALFPPPSGPEISLDLDEHLGRLERHLIRLALARTRGRIAPAARLLGISRNGLKMKCARHGLAL